MSDISIPLGYDIDTVEKIATRPEDLSLIDRQKELALRRQGYMIQLQRIPLPTNDDLTKKKTITTMAKKEKNITNIAVRTVPNGYSLTIGNNEYLYFTEVNLLEGMLYHIGMKKPDYVSNEAIKLIVDTLKAWSPISMDNIKAHLQIESLTSQLEECKIELASTESKLQSCDKALALEPHNYRDAVKELQVAEKTVSELKKEIETLQQKLAEKEPATEAETPQASEAAAEAPSSATEKVQEATPVPEPKVEDLQPLAETAENPEPIEQSASAPEKPKTRGKKKTPLKKTEPSPKTPLKKSSVTDEKETPSKKKTTAKASTKKPKGKNKE